MNGQFKVNSKVKQYAEKHFSKRVLICGTRDVLWDYLFKLLIVLTLDTPYGIKLLVKSDYLIIYVWSKMLLIIVYLLLETAYLKKQ